ncbi:glycoside hydrolase family 65 protein [Luteipulveratus flavus]|uniref:Glycosyl hydrolase family 65 protein n=1 Tax=Luteipulveratus flavus TaxID=3031728 RepID=A0ABT6C7F5_9MICO|nr:glycosyl hydrolase family 65 protein [Luteipulveratus sp. YIM 133296]MDF8264874.1 glycosyl hydrolase family 65 protein [Luteipulveratus sp. YIM 133296]
MSEAERVGPTEDLAEEQELVGSHTLGDNHRILVEPWQVREVGLSQESLAVSESLFTLSNGHIGARGNLDEGDPSGLPGTYLASFYETRPLPYAEAGYGYPESGQTVVNVTDGKLIRLLVDDEPLDLRYGEIISHERVLDLRRGVLERDLVWRSPADKLVRIRSTRLVSLTRRSLLAINYRVEPVDRPLRVVAQSELVANEHTPSRSDDPRVTAAMKDVLKPVDHHADGLSALLIHRTRASKLQLAAAMDHHIFTPNGHSVEAISHHPNWARVSVSTSLQPGEQLRMVKFVSYGWSSQRSMPALRDQVAAALMSARDAHWEGVLEEQERAYEEFWAGADVELDGPVEIQQAVRFNVFHAYQAGARTERRAIAAKGLTGTGYDGHAFWDTEQFVLPLLTVTAPDAANDALRWRLSTLELAKERASTLRLNGAAFPWRTIRGQECSAYWPAGTAAVHVNADVAVAAARHLWWTQDEDFGRECAQPLLVETARLWMSLGHVGADECFHIDGVTGPDEYTAVCDDNIYTNLMAAQNLRSAAYVARRWPAADVDDAEIESWLDAAGRMSMPYNEDKQVHEQCRGFTDWQEWDFERSARDEEYPLLLHAPYFDLYRKQVIKQADLMLALHWCGEAFTDEEKARAFAYYEPITVRDSSLSACTQAVVAAEVGHLDLAAEYLAEAALMDLKDLEHNARDGLHIASMAGGWLALVAGFGGMRSLPERLLFRPQLPPGWHRLRFAVRPKQCRLTVEITAGSVRYALAGDEPLELTHCSGREREDITLQPGEPISRPWTAVEPLTPRPAQPPGRAPVTL